MLRQPLAQQILEHSIQKLKFVGDAQINDEFAS